MLKNGGEIKVFLTSKLSCKINHLRDPSGGTVKIVTLYTTSVVALLLNRYDCVSLFSHPVQTYKLCGSFIDIMLSLSCDNSFRKYISS